MHEFIAWNAGMEAINMNTTEKEMGPKITKVFGPP
jgi:hypothetical protein